MGIGTSQGNSEGGIHRGAWPLAREPPWGRRMHQGAAVADALRQLTAIVLQA